jgi:hypothetical protein
MGLGTCSQSRKELNKKPLSLQLSGSSLLYFVNFLILELKHRSTKSTKVRRYFSTIQILNMTIDVLILHQKCVSSKKVMKMSAFMYIHCKPLFLQELSLAWKRAIQLGLPQSIKRRLFCPAVF